MSLLRKILLTTIVTLIAVLACTDEVDEKSQTLASDALKRALVTFAVVRALDGVISVAQGTEIIVEPAGFGANFSVGEILDPINDLVERFSGVLLAATTALFAQSVLLKICAWWGWKLMVVLAALYYLARLWLPGQVTPLGNVLAFRFLLLTVFVRYAVAALILASNLVVNLFLEPEIVRSTQALESTTSEIKAISAEDEEAAAETRTWKDRLSQLWGKSVDAVNVGGRIDALKGRSDTATEHVIKLIGVFILETIAIPLFFFWLLAALFRFLISINVDAGPAPPHA